MMKDVPWLFKNVRKPKQRNMYDFVWTSIFPMLIKIKGSLGIPCNQMFSNIPQACKVNGKRNFLKTLELWVEMQWRVKVVYTYGWCWAETDLIALICKMSKIEGKLSDKELGDNFCCLYTHWYY